MAVGNLSGVARIPKALKVRGADDLQDLTVLQRMGLHTRHHRCAADGSAGATRTEYVGRFYEPRKVYHVVLTPDSTLTAHDTNYATISVMSGSTTLASMTTKITGGSGDWVAGTSYTLTLSTTAADLLLAAGAVLKVVYAKAGSGVQAPALAVSITTVSR